MFQVESRKGGRAITTFNAPTLERPNIEQYRLDMHEAANQRMRYRGNGDCSEVSLHTNRSLIMRVVFHAIGDIRLDNVSDPKIDKPTDAIVRLTG